MSSPGIKQHDGRTTIDCERTCKYRRSGRYLLQVDVDDTTHLLRTPLLSVLLAATCRVRTLDPTGSAAVSAEVPGFPTIEARVAGPWSGGSTGCLELDTVVAAVAPYGSSPVDLAGPQSEAAGRTTVAACRWPFVSVKS